MAKTVLLGHCCAILASALERGMDNKALVQTGDVGDGIIVCENSRGTEIRGVLLRLTRHEVSFELYSASELVQTSEVLSNFQLFVRDQPIYSGRAVISGVVNNGPVIICQASLQDAWLDLDVLHLAKSMELLPQAFGDLIRSWQKVYSIVAEYKLAVADIQSFLFELGHWLQEVALGLSGTKNGEYAEAERKAAEQIAGPVAACLDQLFEKFELAARPIPPAAQPAHAVYVRRQLHPLLLCSPFMHRIYRKPLGYAGDYEVVNMMLRDPYEGSSLCAKVLNRWVLGKATAEAHRNRIKRLTRHLTVETLRVRAEERSARFFNLGCGPAKEVCDFMAQSELSNQAEATLLDFNQETLAYARTTLEETQRRYHRAMRIQLVRKSVAQVLKSRMPNIVPEYDMVYCAGLFDYLPDRACQQLADLFYAMLRPGGLLLLTNVDPSNPLRQMMNYLFEWHLIERTGPQLRTLAPREAHPDDCKVTADDTFCNVFLEVRKPKALV